MRNSWKKWKKYIALTVSVVLFGCSTVPVLAQQSQEIGTVTETAKKSTHYELNLPYHLAHAEGNIDARYFSCIIQIERGQDDFCIGDLVQYTKCNQDREILFVQAASQCSGFSYRSENTANVTVDAKTGVLNPKREGTAVIHVTKGSLKADITVIVAAKGRLGTKAKKYDTVRSKLKKLVKDYGKGISEKNCYAVYNDLQKLRKEIKSQKTLSSMYKGFGMGSDKRPNNELVLPQLAKADAIRYALHNFSTKVDPTNTSSKNVFAIDHIQGKGSKVTVTLKKKIDKVQAFGLQCFEPYDEEDLNHLDEYERIHPDTLRADGEISWSLYIKDTKTGESDWGEAASKVGKKDIKIELPGASLKKGRKYMLRDTQYTISKSEEKKHWTRGKTFTAK